MRSALTLLALLTALMRGGLFYPTLLTVTAVEKGVVTMEDRRGNEYLTDAAEAWDVGDKAAAIMWSNGTFDKTDDEIMAMEYVGR